jgi:hypothetical protein
MYTRWYGDKLYDGGRREDSNVCIKGYHSGNGGDPDFRKRVRSSSNNLSDQRPERGAAESRPVRMPSMGSSANRI